jgi:uncharacterized membrane protein
MNSLLFGSALATVAIAGIPYVVFWPYCLALAVFVTGLIVIIKTDLPGARGIDAVLPFGRLFYCMAVAGFAGEHFVFSTQIASMVPQFIPFHMFWAIFCGICLLLSAFAIVTKIQARLAATMLGIMLFLFVVLLSVPATFQDPHNRFSWALVLRDSSFASAALAFAGSLHRPRVDGSPHWLVTFGRTVIAIAAVFFGVEHFIHPQFVPAIPLEKAMPAAVPLPMVIAYGMGAVLIAAGLCMLLNIRAREAAEALGVTILLVILIVYLPILLAAPSDIGVAFNYFFDTLMYAGAVLMLAGALPRSVTKPVLKEGHAHA